MFNIDTQTERRDRQTYRWTGRWTDTDRQIVKWTVKQTGRWTVKQTDKETPKQTDTWTGRQADRQ